jgi:GNAT superfamily N-acetyltransferase
MTFRIPLLTNTSIPNFIIRKAEAEDTPLVLDFIKQLAVYEKMIDDVVATEETLKDSLFGETPFAQVVIGEFNGQPVGFALFFTNFSTFLGRPGIFLEDLFVLPEHRGKGYGKTLLAFLAKLAVDNSFGRVEWSVLNWNQPAIDVYKGIGAKPMDEWTVFRLTKNEMNVVSEKL